MGADAHDKPSMLQALQEREPDRAGIRLKSEVSAVLGSCDHPELPPDLMSGAGRLAATISRGHATAALAATVAATNVEWPASLQWVFDLCHSSRSMSGLFGSIWSFSGFPFQGFSVCRCVGQSVCLRGSSSGVSRGSSFCGLTIGIAYLLRRSSDGADSRAVV